MRRFDTRFGTDFLASVPTGPGVYRFLDASNAVVYVGKASNLRRRLTQYRNAGSTRRGRKPHRIMKDAVSLSFEVFESELDASLEEVRLIQQLRPRHNVASAFEFLYPFIGFSSKTPLAGLRTRELTLVLTSKPDLFPELHFHGAYRSRETVALGFFAAIRLVRHLAHPEPKARLKALAARDEHAIPVALRRVPEFFVAGLEALLRGDSLDVLGELMVALLELPSARAKAAEIQADVALVNTFFFAEAMSLRRVVDATAYDRWPVPQADRDPLFLKYRAST